MKPKTALIGSQSRVELHTVSSIDLKLVLVILPDNTKLDDTFRDGGDF